MQDTSLTISSTTSSTSTFPSVSPWIYSLLTEIINTLPASASTFEQLFTRYQQVLAERGIDEAEAEGEQDAYALLLKLSMQRGSTWAQKWASAQRALPPTASPSLDVLKARLDSLDATQQFHGHQTTAPPAKTSQSLSIPYIGARLSSQVDGPLTSTPQRPRSAPPRRHAPKPEEQVTPVKTPRRVSFLSPRRSASTADLSRSRTLLDDSDQDEDTPEPVLPPHPRSSRPSYATPVSHHQQHEQLAPDPKVVFADRFRRASLLTGFFDRWRDRAEVQLQREEQTTQLRQTVILKRSIAVWSLKLRYTADVLEPKADTWSDLNVARKTLGSWVLKMRRKRKQDWEDRMRTGLEEFKAKTEPRLLAEAWDCWRERFLEVRADRFYKTTLLSPTFKKWSATSQKTRQLNHAAADLLRIKQAERMYIYLEQWHRATALRLAEREVAARHDEIAVRTAWQTWYHRRQRVHAADMWSNVKVARKALTAWSSRLMTVDTLQLQAEEHDKRRQKDKARSLLKTWSLKTRAQTFDRDVVETNVSRKALHTWLIRCHTVAVEYEERADTFRLEADSKMASGVLLHWRTRLAGQTAVAEAADATAATTRLTRSLRVWQNKLKERKLDKRKADVARDFFLSRRVWVKWGLRLIEKRGKELQSDREMSVKKTFFSAWLQKTRQVQSENALVEGFQSAIDVRLVQDTLQIWVQRVVDLRSRQMSVSQERDGKVLHFALLKWRNRARKRLQDHDLVESFQDVKQEDSLRRFFWEWNSKMHTMVDRRQKAEAKGRADRAMLLTAAFDKWRSKARKQKLSRLEVAFGKAKDQVQLTESLIKWRQKSKMLPAMRFSERLAQKHAFDVWREAVPYKQKLIMADGHYARKILSEAVGKWRYVWKSRVNRRAADRFRPRQLQRHSLPVQPSAPSPTSYVPTRPSLSESSSEPMNLLQARLRHRMKLQSQIKSAGTSSSTPTLVEDTHSASDATERTPLDDHFTRRAARPPKTSLPLDSSAVNSRSIRPAPSVSTAGSSSAAGMALSEIRARLKQRSSMGANASRPASTPPSTLEAGRQRLAAFRSRRAESITDTTESSFASSSFT